MRKAALHVVESLRDDNGDLTWTPDGRDGIVKCSCGEKVRVIHFVEHRRLAGLESTSNIRAVDLNEPTPWRKTGRASTKRAR